MKDSGPFELDTTRYVLTPGGKYTAGPPGRADVLFTTPGESTLNAERPGS